MTREARARGGVFALPAAIPRFITGVVQLADATARRSVTANVPALSAAIAFHALLSLAPLLLLVLTAASSILGREGARARLLAAIAALGDPAVVAPLRATVLMIVGARVSVLANAAGVLIMMYFASAVFHEVGTALERIWDVPPRPGIGGMLVQRLIALVLVPAAVAAGMAAMAVTFLHAVAAPIVSNLLPHGSQAWALSRLLIPFVLTMLLLGFLYRYGPRASLRWSDVHIGTVLAALAFSAGNAVLGTMLRKSLLASLYGAAGALVLILLWVFYSTQLVLIGACFTREYADRFGSRSARRVTPAARA